MICGPCRTLHDSEPEGCPPGCPCQHKGKAELKPEPPKKVRWGCHVCGVTFPLASEECHCEVGDPDQWFDIYEHEIPDLGA